MTQPVWFKRTVTVVTTSQEREAVLHAQRVMRCAETGGMDDQTIGHLKGFQTLFGLPATGCLDLETAKQIENIRIYGSTEGAA